MDGIRFVTGRYGLKMEISSTETVDDYMIEPTGFTLEEFLEGDGNYGI